MHIKHLHFLEHIEIPEFTECEWNYPCPSLPAVEDELTTADQHLFSGGKN